MDLVAPGFLVRRPAYAENQNARGGKAFFNAAWDLYNDGVIFAGAVVEFKKALRDPGRAPTCSTTSAKTQYQLMDYAAALGTMNRYLAETRPLPPAHRAEVESTVEILRGRGGADRALDRQPGCERSPSTISPWARPHHRAGRCCWSRWALPPGGTVTWLGKAAHHARRRSERR